MSCRRRAALSLRESPPTQRRCTICAARRRRAAVPSSRSSATAPPVRAQSTRLGALAPKQLGGRNLASCPPLCPSLEATTPLRSRVFRSLGPAGGRRFPALEAFALCALARRRRRSLLASYSHSTNVGLESADRRPASLVCASSGLSWRSTPASA